MKKDKTKGLILYIDDEVEACRTIAEFLTLRGFDVTIAFDGESGYDIVKRTKPSLIIMDLKIAGVSGIDLIQRLKDEHIETPVIVVTAYEEAISEIDEKGLMIHKYFTKPYKLVDLYNIVKEILEVI